MTEAAHRVGRYSQILGRDTVTHLAGYASFASTVKFLNFRTQEKLL